MILHGIRREKQAVILLGFSLPNFSFGSEAMSHGTVLKGREKYITFMYSVCMDYICLMELTIVFIITTVVQWCQVQSHI